MSLLNRSLFALLLMVPQMEGFLLPSHSHPSTNGVSTTASTLLRAEEKGNQKGEDLFDYFDPLLSPHAYPNGIDAGPATSEESSSSSSTKNNSNKPSASSFLGFDTPPAAAEPESTPPEQSTGTKETKHRQDDDLFDYFDPLLSPHAYPNGIDAGAAADATTKKEAAGAPMSSAPPSPLEVIPSQSSAGAGAAPNKKKKKVGVLLMDHGSRNSASNSRLEKMAELYQLTANYDGEDDDDTIVVEAAHMEIASPSIAEGLKKLLDQGVDEIICHPYFLSPGRHVTEDIPQLLEEAKNELKIDNIPMVATKPIGANTQLMIGAIHALVQENSSVLQNQNQL